VGGGGEEVRVYQVELRLNSDATCAQSPRTPGRDSRAVSGQEKLSLAPGGPAGRIEKVATPPHGGLLQNTVPEIHYVTIRHGAKNYIVFIGDGPRSEPVSEKHVRRLLHGGILLRVMTFSVMSSLSGSVSCATKTSFHVDHS
jgi:hypothetical protein